MSTSSQSCGSVQAFVDHTPVFDKRYKSRGSVTSKKGFIRPDKRRKKKAKFL